jgi:Mg2+-importing ATPase
MQKKDVIALDPPAVLHALQTSEQGLSTAEATVRLGTQGQNVRKKSPVSAWNILQRQFQNALVYLLVAASLISFVVKDYSDGIVILAILSINTLLGFFQEYKSERIIQKLESFISKTVRVKRNGHIILLDESLIVPGDIVVLKEGDIAPADMRVIEVEDVQVNESALTGESALVSKDTTSIIYAGSVIEKGEATGAVYATDGQTEFGAIVRLSTETKKETEYEKSLHAFSTFLLKVVLLALTIIFFAKFFLNRGGLSLTALLLFIISMAIMVVPEVLPVIATVSLSSGALRLAKKHVVVKRLSSVEDLGNISMLCTDKTGTITENKMTVQSLVASDTTLFQLFAAATIVILKNRKRRVADAYDDAFIAYIPKELQEQAKAWVIMKEVPFDPTDKRRRVVVHDTATNHYYLVVIGAPEALLAIAESDNKASYLQTISNEGSTGLHHVGMAYKSIAYTDAYDILQDENNLSFLGYVSLTDPLRASAKLTIEQAEKLGIQIKILTGDSKEVATYIGMQIGLIQQDSATSVYTGDELEALSEEDFSKALQHAHVFARVTPVQKFNIIKALKNNFVVGYQGDGINDAPALKLADVAIAVNSATDIAKDNADIVLLNKDLSVIINGIRYGRTIFVNINKYIKYTMVNNFGSFMALAVLYLFSRELPILPIQVLLTNVLTDIPLVSIYSDTVEDADIVKPERHNIKELLFISLMLGVPTALFELLYYLLIRSQPMMNIQTSLYLFFTFTALIVFYALRSNNFFWKGKAPSVLLNSSFLLTFVISFSIIYIPLFQHWFHFIALSAQALGLLIGTTLVYFLILDVMKAWYYRSAVAKITV